MIVFPSDPSIGFSKFKLTLQRKSIGLTSPYSGKQQFQGFPFALWKIDATITPIDCIMFPVGAGKMKSFLAQLQGQVNTFLITPPDVTNPKTGYIGVNGVVNGSGQTGTTLITNSWQSNSTIIYEGEHFTVNGEFKIATSSVNSDSNGNATFNFMPALRNSPISTTVVNVSYPQIQIAADHDDVANWQTDYPIIQSMSFTAMERF